MAECIIARGGYQISSNESGGSDDSPLIIPGFATAIVTVVDSKNKPVSRCYITAYDGKSWANTHTNNAGKVQFILNNTKSRIRAYNYSIVDNTLFVDHNISSFNYYNTNVSECTNITIQLPRVTSQRYTSMTSNIRQAQGTTLYNKIKFLSAVEVRNIRLGGGGGGGYSIPTSQISTGGGGGELVMVNNMKIPTGQIINNVYVGNYGLGTTSAAAHFSSDAYKCNKPSGGTGGSTTFMGKVAIGGGGGTSIGGIGANNGYWGNGKGKSSDNASSKDTLYGGGGGCYYSYSPGTPNGANGPKPTYESGKGKFAYTTGGRGGIGGGGGGGSLNIIGWDASTNNRYAYPNRWIGGDGGTGFISFDIEF